MLKLTTVAFFVAFAATTVFACDFPLFVKDGEGDNPTACEDYCSSTYGTQISLFMHGSCSDEPVHDACHGCVYKLRLWTTIFIFVVLAGAVTVLVLLMPMCITSCASCCYAKKDNKRKKRAAQAGDGMDGPGGKQAAVYNPYAYWPYYGRA